MRKSSTPSFVLTLKLNTSKHTESVPAKRIIICSREQADYISDKGVFPEKTEEIERKEI